MLESIYTLIMYYFNKHIKKMTDHMQKMSGYMKIKGHTTQIGNISINMEML